MHRNLFLPQSGAGGLSQTRRPILQASGFLPSDLSGLQGWYECGDVRSIYCHEHVSNNDPCEDNEVCLRFEDRSGNARHLTVAANGPTYQQPQTTDGATPGAKGRLVFDGTNDVLRAGTAGDWRFTVDGTGLTLRVVANLAAGTNKPIVDTGGYAGGQIGMAVLCDDVGGNTGRVGMIIRKAGGTQVAYFQAPSNANTWPAGEWHGMGGDYVSGGPLRVFMDGSFIGSDAEDAAPTTGTNPGQALTLCHDGGGNFGAHSIAAAILYNRVLADTEQRRLDLYLAQRYAYPVGNVACLGDSITLGAQVASPYPARLAKLLGSLYRVSNFGVNGAVVNESGAANDLYNDQWLAITTGAKRRRYNWFVVLGGINDLRGTSDSAATIFARLDDLLDEIKAEPLARLVLCTLSPAGNSVLWGSVNPDQARLEAYNTAIRNYVAANPTNCHLVDLYALLGSAGDATKIADALDFDGLHPNQSGTDLIAAAVADRIQSAGLL